MDQLYRTALTKQNYGRKLTNYLNSNDNVFIDVGPNEPTHIRGNRIDYFLTSNLEHASFKRGIASTLLSDHKAILLEITMPQMSIHRKIKKRKRLILPTRHIDMIKEKMDKWHRNYEPQAMDKYERDMVHEVEDAITKEHTRKERESRRPDTKWFNKDPAVTRGKKQYIKLKQKYYKHPSRQNKDALDRMEKQLQRIIAFSKEKY